MVYRSGMADTRPVLASEKAALSGAYCITGDGRITSSCTPLSSFDGESWRPCKGIDTSHVGVPLDWYGLIPGQNGWVLTFMGVRTSEMKISHGVLSTPMSDPFFRFSTARRRSRALR